MSHQRRISVTGLGYVGLTIAAAFGQKIKVIGFDINQERISELKEGYDRNNEHPREQLKKSEIDYTSDPNDLKSADFHIVSVPTPLNEMNHPDLSMLLSASEIIGKQLKNGDVVVYESTVYPGVTEEKCIPVLEKASQLICGRDFGVGYSPERINPGDRAHTLENIIKVVSAIDEKSLELIAEVYGQIVKSTHRVSSIKVAEATKIVENIQRDINISLMNEIVFILHRCNMQITEVLEAAETKWNFAPYSPGLVGGHCIGVNSYYLAHKALEVGYYPRIILAGQEANKDMIKYVADKAINGLSQSNKIIKNARIAILGITYKEDYPDFHDSKIMDLIKIFSSYDIEVFVHDPIVNYSLVKNECKINLVEWNTLKELDALVLAVAHKEYHELNELEFNKVLKPNAFIMDIKGIINPSKVPSGIRLWKM